MRGAGGATPGKLVKADKFVLKLETRWSDKQYFATDEVQSFWCDEDEPKENE